MNWKRETEHNIVSDCGQFRICKSKAATPEQKALGEWVFVAFKKGQVLRAGTLCECKDACHD